MNLLDLATIQISIDGDNQAIISGTYQGKPLGQTVPLARPCLLMFDPVTMNFYTVSIQDSAPTDLTVEVYYA